MGIQQSGLIDDQARHIVLETAFRVACADGTIESEEKQKLQAVAKALGINEGVLELEIDTFQRQPDRSVGATPRASGLNTAGGM